MAFPKESSSGADQEYSTRDAQVIFILGGPGAGKGTQCQKLVQDLDVVYISIGDVLRADKEEILVKTGVSVENCMRNGTLCPINIILSMLKREIRKHLENGKTKMLVDGPRSLVQLLGIEDEVVDPIAAVRFDAPRDVLLARVLERARTSNRVDDNEETFKKRYENERKEMKLMMYYLVGIRKIVKVNCGGDLDDNYANVKQTVEDIFAGRLKMGFGTDIAGREKLRQQKQEWRRIHSHVVDLMGSEALDLAPAGS